MSPALKEALEVLLQARAADEARMRARADQGDKVSGMAADLSAAVSEAFYRWLVPALDVAADTAEAMEDSDSGDVLWELGVEDIRTALITVFATLICNYGSMTDPDDPQGRASTCGDLMGRLGTAVGLLLTMPGPDHSEDEDGGEGDDPEPVADDPEPVAHPEHRVIQ